MNALKSLKKGQTKERESHNIAMPKTCKYFNHIQQYSRAVTAVPNSWHDKTRQDTKNNEYHSLGLYLITKDACNFACAQTENNSNKKYQAG